MPALISPLSFHLPAKTVPLFLSMGYNTRRARSAAGRQSPVASPSVRPGGGASRQLTSPSRRGSAAAADLSRPASRRPSAGEPVCFGAARGRSRALTCADVRPLLTRADARSRAPSNCRPHVGRRVISKKTRRPAGPSVSRRCPAAAAHGRRQPGGRAAGETSVRHAATVTSLGTALCFVEEQSVSWFPVGDSRRNWLCPGLVWPPGVLCFSRVACSSLGPVLYFLF